MTIAIIGAGMAGAACASALTQRGQQVVVFDKGRSAGGRMSSKRTDHGYLDLGAQYFTARSAAFIAQCQRWSTGSSIASWSGRLAVLDAEGVRESPDETQRYIGIPSMQAPVSQLLDNITVHLSCQVDAIAFDGKNWRLFSQGAMLGCFSQLVLAVPQQQAAQLLGSVVSSCPGLAEVFTTPALLPCWAVNIQLDEPLWPYDGIFVKHNSTLSWLARQSSKAGRCNGQQWLLHFTPAFSQMYLEADSSTIIQQAMSALQVLAGRQPRGMVSQCHRWRFAQQNPDYPVSGTIYRPELGLGLAGDWLNGGRVENAWLSGVKLAQEIVA